MTSRIALIISCFIIFLTSFFYYPKFNKSGSEATISWDVSGYYWYLPSIFIYNDIKFQKFAPKIFEKYGPTPEVQQYIKNRNGAYVMRYSIGQAILYSPFFFIAHIIASPLGFEADGFSLPYQFAIQFASVLISFLGLFYLRKVLLKYFSDMAVAMVIFSYVLGTNYLNYSAIDNAMTHNWLFTIYILIIYRTILLYDLPNAKNTLLLGLLIGLAALVRPTDFIAIIIPILWGIDELSIESIKTRLLFLWEKKKLVLLITVVIGLIGFIQLTYYKYAGEEWYIYTYQGFTFSWLSPHTKDYLFSFRTGWLIYTPLFFLAIIGLFMMKNKRFGWVGLLLFIILNTYIVSAWDVWWYGARAMIQSYPILAFPLASIFDKGIKNIWFKYILFSFIAFCSYFNIWWTHGVHKGGYYDAYDSTKAYFYKAFGKFNVPKDYIKLYDTNEYFDGERKNVKSIYENNFDSDTMLVREGRKINNTPCEYLTAAKQSTRIYEIPIKQSQAKWIRVRNTFQCTQKEWNFWLMSQVVVRFWNGNQVIKTNIYRPQRFLIDGQMSDLYFDVKVPRELFTKAEVYYINASGQKEFYIDNLIIESFDE